MSDGKWGAGEDKGGFYFWLNTVPVVLPGGQFRRSGGLIRGPSDLVFAGEIYPVPLELWEAEGS